MKAEVYGRMNEQMDNVRKAIYLMTVCRGINIHVDNYVVLLYIYITDVNALS